ncbi:hypothetical protein ACKUB1_17885 [Methanospirillum stamsii]|uniref:hypothetical protein n=1 Tax=Methanospirillum stamsii TaxID=1277351 RepID=UPI0015E875A4|nr:hypothetical protein [Methanospirillum stamsii]
MATIITTAKGKRTVKTSVLIPEELFEWAKAREISISGTISDKIRQMRLEEVSA